MGLKQKDALTRFALTIGEYEVLVDGLTKYLKQDTLDPRDKHRALVVLEAAENVLDTIVDAQDKIREDWDKEDV